MMYLVIKELSGIAEDVIMVTQSLIKDIQSKQETIYRANAIRALCLITDVNSFKEHSKPPMLVLFLTLLCLYLFSRP
jgi:uncharacterized membrane protein YadS